MSSKPGGKKAKWGSPAGWFLKGIIWKYYKDGHREDSIGECLRRHVSREVYVKIIGQDVNDNAIMQRGHKGVLPKNAFEHPDKHLIGMKMLPYALKAIENNRHNLSLEDINEIVNEALSSTETITLEKVTEMEKGDESGILYVASTGSSNCIFGITTKNDARKRMAAFAKGDIDRKIIDLKQMWLVSPRKIETLLKRKFKEEHLGNERYAVPADTIWHFLKKYANEHQIAHYTIVDNDSIIKEAAE